MYSKSYINDYLFPARNDIDQCRNISYILKQLEVSQEDYFAALAISNGNDYEVHLIHMPNSCFVNNYFESALLAWQVNRDMQPIFND